MKTVKLNVNGEDLELNVESFETLLEALRNRLELTGAKYGCGTGECGACTVIIDGEARLACLTLAAAVDGKSILTVEGLAKAGRFTPLQEAFIKHGGIQCGFCTPGLLMTATALLRENPKASEAEIKEYLKGNLCRCTGYMKIIDAVKSLMEREGYGKV